MHFRFLFILFAAGVFLRIPAAAEFSLAADVEVGTEPGQMFYYNGYFHVFCMGHDANSNQQYDEGDEYPSLWKISEADPASSPKKIMEFPIDDIKIGTDYSFDPTSGIVYKTYNDTLQAVNLNIKTIEIYSADARLIQTIDTFGEMQSNSKFSINCSNLSSGV